MHIERVLREYGQSLRPMSDAPRDGTPVLAHAVHANRFVLCRWESDPSVLAGPAWIENGDIRTGFLDRYFDGWLDPRQIRLLDANAINRLLVAYIDDARAADDTEALKLLEQP